MLGNIGFSERAAAHGSCDTAAFGCPTTPSSGTVTELLRAWGDGDDAALEQLTPLVEAELRRLARAYMARERRDHTLQPTALVNEAFLRLTEARRVRWQDRAHFLGISARLMRRVLVDHARARGYRKRGGGAERVTLVDGLVASPERHWTSWRWIAPWTHWRRSTFGRAG